MFVWPLPPGKRNQWTVKVFAVGQRWWITLVSVLMLFTFYVTMMFPVTAWSLASEAVALRISIFSICNLNIWAQFCLSLNANTIRSVFLDWAFLFMQILLMLLAVGVDLLTSAQVPDQMQVIEEVE